MNLKAIITAGLLGFVGLSIGAMVFKEARTPDVATEPGAKQSDIAAPLHPQAAVHVVVYYFHGDTRCTTCRAIEEQSQAAITEYFKEELGTGRLEWRLVNYDRPGDAHFRDDFQLAFQSIVLVEERDGKATRWQNLTDVWTKIHATPQEFEQYVVESTAAFLAGEGA